MIKFRAAVDGKPLIGLGLSEGNIQKLKEGMPIHISAADMKQLIGIEAAMIIMYGRTEQEITEELSSFIGPETKIHEE